MPLLQVIVLGVVQGLTEFLPISSQAHLALVPWLLGWPDQGLSFDIALHLGTLAAVLVYFFRDWVQVIGQAFGWNAGGDADLRQNRSLLWLMALGTVPAAAAGILVKEQAETVWRYNQYLIGAMFIVVGIFMWWADRRARRTKDVGQITMADAALIGAAQALALVPGVSRSGITIATGLLRDLDRAAAARFSFLLSTPTIAGAAAKDFYDLMQREGGIPADLWVSLGLGIVVSGVTGALTIRFFLRFLRRRSLNFFVAYRLVFGIMVIALAVFFRYSGG
jgi:undecaprenyl-diphosphatase